MRLLRGIPNWGLCPQTPGIYRFFLARMDSTGFHSGDGLYPSPPFRPLNRSLGSLPSVALSLPAQVRSLSTKPPRGSTKKQRTETTLLTRCLTFGVQFKVSHFPTRPRATTARFL
jgi:hypothetical protein